MCVNQVLLRSFQNHTTKNLHVAYFWLPFHMTEELAEVNNSSLENSIPSGTITWEILQQLSSESTQSGKWGDWVTCGQIPAKEVHICQKKSPAIIYIPWNEWEKPFVLHLQHQQCPLLLVSSAGKCAGDRSHPRCQGASAWIPEMTCVL